MSLRLKVMVVPCLDHVHLHLAPATNMMCSFEHRLLTIARMNRACDMVNVFHVRMATSVNAMPGTRVKIVKWTVGRRVGWRRVKTVASVKRTATETTSVNASRDTRVNRVKLLLDRTRCARTVAANVNKVMDIAARTPVKIPASVLNNLTASFVIVAEADTVVKRVNTTLMNVRVRPV